MSKNGGYLSSNIHVCIRMSMLSLFLMGCSENTLVVARSIEFLLRIKDPMVAELVEEVDPMRFTEAPSLMPSLAPSSSPSLYPSSSPSSTPSDMPSSTPSFQPSLEPSSLPSDQPTLTPSISPSLDPTETHSDAPSLSPSEMFKSPLYGELGYFNYNPNDKEYGPDAWGKVQESIEWQSWSKWPSEVWKFDLNNQCDRNWRPSPIDVCDGVGFGGDLNKTLPMNNVNTPCYEYHRILTDAGDWEIDDTSRISMHILPSKLRMEYAVRDCAYQDEFVEHPSPVWFPLPPDKGGKYDWCSWEPPAADFPNHWNGHVQPIHIDIKIPSEHTICGRRFDGEFTVWHIHPQRRAALAMSTLIEIGQYNKELQIALDQWQVKFDDDLYKCSAKKNRELKEHKKFLNRMDNFLQYGVDQEHFTPRDDTHPEQNVSYSTQERTYLEKGSESPAQEHEFNSYFDLVEDEAEHIALKQKENKKRKLNNYKRFNPYHPDIYRSVWFYGYWGTMTEPPCSDRFINWIIMDAPLEISQGQYDQIRRLLLLYQDPNCILTSNAHRGAVARPTQPFNNRNLWRCNRERWEQNFEPWKCDGHDGTQYGCIREEQTMIVPPPTFSPTKLF